MGTTKGRSSYHENQAEALEFLQNEQDLAKNPAEINVSPTVYTSRETADAFAENKILNLASYFLLIPFNKKENLVGYICYYKYEQKNPKTREQMKEEFLNDTDGFLDDFLKHRRNSLN